jgi:oxygen-independent coproporphyrinogen III oxidase
LYGLTVEPSTPISKWRDHGAVVEAPEEGYEEEFLPSHRVLTGAGYRHYEISNYALANNLARHNSSYWRGIPYGGLGPSAHGFDGAVTRRLTPCWKMHVRF